MKKPFGYFGRKKRFRVLHPKRKTAIANNFPKTNRDCEQFLHFYHAKIVTIDTRLLWHSISCINAFKVTKVHKGIAVNHIFQIAYTQEIVCS